MSCAMHLKAIAEMNRWRTVKDGYDTGKTILNGMHGMHRAWFNPDNRLTDTNHLPQISYASGRDRHEKGLYTAKYNVYVITIDELAQGLAGGRFTHPHMTDFELGRLLSGADFYLQENLSTGRPQAAVDGTQTALAAMYILGAAINPDKPGTAWMVLAEG
ncbi:hypothetical protein HYV82_04995 [Candidatus Woesearchaeota archaeon]|nr:hypothetical protein [Candidatus Woesearchaeota archaeon]